MGFFGFGKKKEKEQQSAQAEETRLEAQADETSGAKNAQTPAGDAEQAAQDEKKQGLFSRLWQGLSKTRGNVAGRVDELIEATETIVGENFRLVSVRLAETTTSSTASASSFREKFTSAVLSATISTVVSADR